MRIGTQRGAIRRRLDAALKGAIGLAGGLAFVLLALPWLLDVVVPAIEGIPGGDSPIPVILSGGLAATAFGLVRSTLETRLKYLGGVVLGLIAAVVALLVMDDAAMGGETFSLSQPVYYWGVLIYVALSTFLNPDWWSLQWIYRLRMSQTFSNVIEDGTFRSRSRREQPLISAYRDAAGPRPLICCAAAREDRTITGIPAASFTIDPEEVVVHQWVDGVLESEAMPTCDYEPWIAWTPQHRRQTGLIGAASLSGAAFAPSMGRINVGTTQAALAALNLRLGVWLPNPRADKRSRPALVNMFKEVFGQYDVEAPNLYVTDGGHWENLALVEMVRRRASVIICIDACGDEQYSHNALRQAIELAQLECNVRIDIPAEEMQAMKRATDERLPDRNWAAGTIHYPALSEEEVDGGRPPKVGRLLYVKAQRSRSMPLQVLRYGTEDVTFPNYSTADQFLTDNEFTNLATLGRHSMILAVREKRAVVFQDLVIGSPPPPDGEPDEEQKARLEDYWKRVVHTPFRPKDGRYLDDPYPTSPDARGD